MMEELKDKKEMSIKLDIPSNNPDVFEKMNTEDIITLIENVDECKKKFIDYLLNDTNIFKRQDSYKIFKILSNDLRIDVISYIAMHSNIKYSIKYICEILELYENYDEKQYIFVIFQDNMKYYKKINWVLKVILLLGEMPKEKTLQILMFMFGKYKGKIDKDFLDHISMLLDDEYYKNNMLHLMKSFRYVNVDDISWVGYMKDIFQRKIKNENMLHKIFSCLNMNKEIILMYDNYIYNLAQMRINDKLSFFIKNELAVQIVRINFDVFKIIIYDKNFGILEREFSDNIAINGTSIIS